MANGKHVKPPFPALSRLFNSKSSSLNKVINDLSHMLKLKKASICNFIPDSAIFWQVGLSPLVLNRLLVFGSSLRVMHWLSWYINQIHCAC